MTIEMLKQKCDDAGGTFRVSTCNCTSYGWDIKLHDALIKLCGCGQLHAEGLQLTYEVKYGVYDWTCRKLPGKSKYEQLVEVATAALYALNDIPRTEVVWKEYRDTYQIAAALSNLLKEAK